MAFCMAPERSCWWKALVPTAIASDTSQWDVMMDGLVRRVVMAAMIGSGSDEGSIVLSKPHQRRITRPIMSLQQTVYRQMSSLFPVDDRTDIIAKARSSLGELKGKRSRPLLLPKVRTYIAPGKTLQTTSMFTSVVVPAFATHWGIVVGNIMYHLTFRDTRDAESHTGEFSGKGCPIRFTIRIVEDDITGGKIVGETNYDAEQLISIGKALIDSFGSYHRLFWNCQVFAECFLYLITDGKSFGEYHPIYSILIYQVDIGRRFSVVFMCFRSQSTHRHNIESETREA
jgi:hypothetical protein